MRGCFQCVGTVSMDQMYFGKGGCVWVPKTQITLVRQFGTLDTLFQEYQLTGSFQTYKNKLIFLYEFLECFVNLLLFNDEVCNFTQVGNELTVMLVVIFRFVSNSQ